MAEPSIIETLTASYSRQLAVYEELDGLVRRTLHDVVLSRGDVRGIAGLFKRKQVLIDEISSERQRIQPLAERWQREKETIAPSAATKKLDEILEKTQNVISSFLEGERQMKKFLTHAMENGKPSNP